MSVRLNKVPLSRRSDAFFQRFKVGIVEHKKNKNKTRQFSYCWLAHRLDLRRTSQSEETFRRAVALGRLNTLWKLEKNLVDRKEVGTLRGHIWRALYKRRDGSAGRGVLSLTAVKNEQQSDRVQIKTSIPVSGGTKSCRKILSAHDNGNKERELMSNLRWVND